MRQGRNLVSNSDFNRKRGGSVLNLPSFTSENIVGGGQLRSTKVNASSRSIKGKRAYAHFKGGEGNYTSLMSSDFAGTETMLNSDRRVGGGRNPLEASASGMQAELVFLDSSSKKGGKPFSRLASLWTRNDFSFKKGGAGLTVCTPFHYEGGVC